MREAVDAEGVAHGIGERWLRWFHVHEGLIEPQLTPFELAHLEEGGAHIYALRIALLGCKAGLSGDIHQLVGEPWCQHIAQPLRDAADGQLFCKIQCGPQGGVLSLSYIAPGPGP